MIAVKIRYNNFLCELRVVCGEGNINFWGCCRVEFLASVSQDNNFSPTIETININVNSILQKVIGSWEKNIVGNMVVGKIGDRLVTSQY